MKKILLLGCSGSIGTQTLDVIRCHPEELQLVGVSVGKNIAFLKELLREFPLQYVYSIQKDDLLASEYPDVTFYDGENGLEEIVLQDSYDMLVNALVGFVGFKPTLLAIEHKKDIALANKETLVAGGELINRAVEDNDVMLFPIDSEHSAILQSMQGHRKEDIRRLIITGSGGSFRDLSRKELAHVTLEDALHHPNWNMGAKITIDSATMMNKGFEIMEAHHLFGIPYEKIDVILHKESVVHSMVEYNDGSIIAQMGVADMRLPIKYALLYPQHLSDDHTDHLSLEDLGSLNFKKMDYDRYPLVRLAKDIGKYGGNFGAILIGANDEAVDLFLKERIPFCDIEKYIYQTLKKAVFKKDPTADELVEANGWARDMVDQLWANS